MTKDKFRTWILRKLGSPVINIEVTNDQIDDRIEEAISKFSTFHYDGSDLNYIALNITANEGSYTLPACVIEVTSLLYQNSSPNFTDEPMLYSRYWANNSYSSESSNFSFVPIETWRQMYKNYEKYFVEDPMFEWNVTTKKLTIFEAPSTTQTAYIEVYVKDPDETLYYDNSWMKKYTTALVKKQWGENIGKYEGTALPGGITLNYGRIIDEANTEIDKLEEELMENYSAPPAFFFG